MSELSYRFPLPESAGFTWWNELGWVPPLSESEERLLDFFFCKIVRGIWPHCGGAIATVNDVVGTAYATPCGHRLYQTRIPTGDELVSLEIDLVPVEVPHSHAEF